MRSPEAAIPTRPCTGNLEADISVGVQSRYDLLWWYCLCTLAFGFAFQVLAGKLGLVRTSGYKGTGAL